MKTTISAGYPSIAKQSPGPGPRAAARAEKDSKQDCKQPPGQHLSFNEPKLQNSKRKRSTPHFSAPESAKPITSFV